MGELQNPSPHSSHPLLQANKIWFIILSSHSFGISTTHYLDSGLSMLIMVKQKDNCQTQFPKAKDLSSFAVGPILLFFAPAACWLLFSSTELERPSGTSSGTAPLVSTACFHTLCKLAKGHGGHLQNECDCHRSSRSVPGFSCQRSNYIEMTRKRRNSNQKRSVVIGITKTIIRAIKILVFIFR